MNKSACIGLLPIGMTDVLPPFALCEAKAVDKILNLFGDYDYQRISPTLIEFEDTLLPDMQSDLALQTFRLTDTLSGKILGLRADQTNQVSRIAQTRLKNEPRPLRLAYAGPVVRLFASQKNPARQLMQVGAELIGAACVTADVEILLLALEALNQLDVADVTLDFTLPTLLPLVCKACDICEQDEKALRTCFNAKDFAQAQSILKNKNAKILIDLFDAYGDSDRVLKVLENIKLPDIAQKECQHLIDVIHILKQEKPDLEITVDVLENQGFEYHTGLGFSIYSKTNGVELGKGGRYLSVVKGQSGEPATGLTLYMAEILNLLQPTVCKKRVFVPIETPFLVTQDLREKGYCIVCGTDEDSKKQALHLQCDCIYTSGKVQPLNP